MLLRTGTIAPLFCNPRPKISRLMAATLCYEPTRAVNGTLRYFTIFGCESSPISRNVRSSVSQ